MALQITMIVRADLSDGSTIAQVVRGRQTFNPQANDMRAERDLGVAAARSLTDDALGDFDQSLADWSEAVQKILDANDAPSG